MLCALCSTLVGAHTAAWPQVPETAPQGELRHGRELLVEKRFGEAQELFATFLRAHPHTAQAQLGLGDAQLGLGQYEQAEGTYRGVTAEQPQLWQAHKNVVVVEAALGRWEEFDRERTVLRMARQRGAPGISARESDVIDSFVVRGSRWVVRAYFEPVGRSETRVNFEHFSPGGKVLAYVSLENAAAAQEALKPEDVRIGSGTAAGTGSPQTTLALNWYTGAAHGTIRQYPTGEPPYPRLRADMMRWVAAHEVTGEAPTQESH